MRVISYSYYIAEYFGRFIYLKQNDTNILAEQKELIKEVEQSWNPFLEEASQDDR